MQRDVKVTVMASELSEVGPVLTRDPATGVRLGPGENGRFPCLL